MEQWSEGIYLLGRYNPLNTGCWLLRHGNSGAILELPPYSQGEISPAATAQQIARDLNIQISYLFCTHNHNDHFDLTTAREFVRTFPRATLCLQAGFQSDISGLLPADYFDDILHLTLDDEIVFLVYAPKHSWTDTMVIFRGVICTGDWELNTLRSIHANVPDERKLKSIALLRDFPHQYNYTIHTVFSVHANDRRSGVDFSGLMQDTTVDRQLW